VGTSQRGGAGNHCDFCGLFSLETLHKVDGHAHYSGISRACGDCYHANYVTCESCGGDRERGDSGQERGTDYVQGDEPLSRSDYDLSTRIGEWAGWPDELCARCLISEDLRGEYHAAMERQSGAEGRERGEDYDVFDR
jgi:hypothetical protein